MFARTRMRPPQSLWFAPNIYAWATAMSSLLKVDGTL